MIKRLVSSWRSLSGLGLVGLLGVLGLAGATNFTLVYHHVGAASGGATLGLSAQELAERIVWLQAHGYRFVTGSQIAGVPANQKTATLEFDDGFEDIYQNAFPVLRRYGVPGSVYPILDLMGHPGHFSQAQLDEMVAAGWEAGSHTRTHATLPSLSPSGLARELTFPEGFRCVAYPFGRHDACVRRLAAERTSCGVAGSFSVKNTDPYALLGSQITPWDADIMNLRAATGFDLRVPGLLAGAGTALLDRQGPQQEVSTLLESGPL